MHIEREEKLAQLERILHGRTLHGSDKLKAFLRFVVDRSIDNQEGQLKEYVIATEVFGRGSDFDSRVDSVVRVQAGRLRTKLHEYYETEGKDDGVIILLPKGQYTPVYSYAQKDEDRAGEASAAHAVPDPKEAPVVAGETSFGHVNGPALEAPGGVAAKAFRGADPLLASSRRWRISA